MLSLRKLPIFGWHYGAVSVPRAERIASGIASLVDNRPMRMLDVGCGDGTLATRVSALLGGIEAVGIDIKVQPNCTIAATSYDGETFPHGDGAFDLVTISDVLHHATKPDAVLREALRVCGPRGIVVVKDHFRLGPWSDKVLLAMDVFGNFSQGIVVTGTYLSPPEWVDLIERAGGRLDRLVWPFQVHDLPFRLITRSEYQFLSRIRTGAGATA